MKKEPIEVFKESIFVYEDYRAFFKDYLSLQKKLQSSFTQRYFAKNFGFSSHSFCNYVVNGKRNLSKQMCDKLINALGLTGIKADYFSILVTFNQCKDITEKDRYHEKMQRIRKQVHFSTLSTKQTDFYTKWYYPVLRELVVRSNWRGNYAVLAALVNPKISEKEAQDAITLMLDIGVLKKDGDDFTFITDNIEDGGVPVHAKTKGRREILQLGNKALERFSPQERFCSYATFAANREAYEKINEYYEEFLEKVTKTVADIDCDEVFQLTYQLFPVSEQFKD